MFRLAGGVSLHEVHASCARSAERQNRRDRRTAHGNGTAFTALAPLEQPVLAVQSIQYSGVELPPGPNSWPPNISSGCSVPSTPLTGSAFQRSVTSLPHTAR